MPTDNQFFLIPGAGYIQQTIGFCLFAQLMILPGDIFLLERNFSLKIVGKPIMIYLKNSTFVDRSVDIIVEILKLQNQFLKNY